MRHMRPGARPPCFHGTGRVGKHKRGSTYPCIRFMGCKVATWAAAAGSACDVGVRGSWDIGTGIIPTEARSTHGSSVVGIILYASRVDAGRTAVIQQMALQPPEDLHADSNKDSAKCLTQYSTQKDMPTPWTPTNPKASLSAAGFCEGPR